MVFGKFCLTFESFVFAHLIQHDDLILACTLLTLLNLVNESFSQRFLQGHLGRGLRSLLVFILNYELVILTTGL